jgi:hypothetical protein
VDPEIAAVASAAGTAIVSAMATDAWSSARDGLLSLWRRVRPEALGSVSSDLEATRGAVLRAQGSTDDGAVGALQTMWEGQFLAILLANPSLAEELKQLTLRLETPSQRRDAGVHLKATARDHGRVYQAGRDQNISEK